jgi:LmbE family N-acetylglucosaminyl deacetylase/SAM-dependent methyltransferase
VVSFRHDTAGTPASAWGPWLAALERQDPLAGPAEVDRVVVVAAHPDDETLGAGGLLHLAHERGLEVAVVVASLGEHSHPGSPTHSPERLAQVRERELADALDALSAGRGAAPLLLGLPDGAVAEHVDRLTTRLVEVIGDGRRTLVVAPWRHDGHPDHEAAGTAAAAATQRTGARLVEYPIWFWHWAGPGEAPPDGFSTWPLSDAARAAKARALAAHRSQVAPLSDQPGDETLLGEDLLAHFLGPVETYVVHPPSDTALEDLHRSAADPWGVEDRWYERRKRDLLLAVLPRPGFRQGVEVGCSTGALTLALAQRCDALVAVDASPTALAAARTRLADQPHVELVEARAPDGWPTGSPVDLVVLSEVGYFLSPAALDELAARVRADLAEDGVVVLCHWRHEIEGWAMDAAEVHERAVAGLGLPVLATYADRDVELLLLGGADVMPDPGA